MSVDSRKKFLSCALICDYKLIIKKTQSDPVCDAACRLGNNGGWQADKISRVPVSRSTGLADSILYNLKYLHLILYLYACGASRLE